jgi:hypothetical protein
MAGRHRFIAATLRAEKRVFRRKSESRRDQRDLSRREQAILHAPIPLNLGLASLAQTSAECVQGRFSRTIAYARDSASNKGEDDG